MLRLIKKKFNKKHHSFSLNDNLLKENFKKYCQLMVINPENANLSYCSQVLMRRFEEGGRCYRWTFLLGLIITLKPHIILFSS